MRPYDNRKGKKIFERDERLVRQDLEAWSKSGSSGQNISDSKFQFIDDFVINLLLSGQHPEIEYFAIRNRSEAHCVSIAAMHQNHRFDKRTAALLAERFGRYLLSGDISERINDMPFRHAAIRLDFAEAGAIKITLAYLPDHPTKITEADVKKSIFCDGYIVPIRIPSDPVIENLHASGHFSNPLSFSGELLSSKATTVRVLCAMLVLGQAGIGSLRGRSTAEATAFIDIWCEEMAINMLHLGLPFAAIMPDFQADTDYNISDRMNKFLIDEKSSYQDIRRNYAILSDRFMSILFFADKRYNECLEAVFSSGHRGLLT